MAPTKMPNSIAPVSAERSQTSRNTGQVRLPLNSASRTEPPAPTPAASVGVAQPANIEPSTNAIRKIGGTKLLTIISQNSPRVSGPCSSGSGGARCGLKCASAQM